jgi:flavin-dependent dehydrogenase
MNAETLSLCELWDVVVIGAGPAGSAAALRCARQGLQVLLVDKAFFPRTKVCGCCLSAHAVEELRQLLPTFRFGHEIQPVHRLRLFAGAAQATLDLAGGGVISREALDHKLVQAAVEQGVSFLPGFTATVHETHDHARLVTLASLHAQHQMRARLVIVADGLAGRALSSKIVTPRNANTDARVGLGAVVQANAFFYQPETIYMACGRQGYAGMVRLEDGRLNVAAAVDPAALRAAADPVLVIAAILKESALPVPQTLTQTPWRGIGPLNSWRHDVAGERLFVLGDAAGYGEPFTGEGMAWALRAGRRLAPLAAKAVARWSPAHASAWRTLYRRKIRKHQSVNRMAGFLLRSPFWTRLAMNSLSASPAIARLFIRKVYGGVAS